MYPISKNRTPHFLYRVITLGMCQKETGYNFFSYIFLRQKINGHVFIDDECRVRIDYWLSNQNIWRNINWKKWLCCFVSLSVRYFYELTDTKKKQNNTNEILSKSSESDTTYIFSLSISSIITMLRCFTFPYSFLMSKSLLLCTVPNRDNMTYLHI